MTKLAITAVVIGAAYAAWQLHRVPSLRLPAAIEPYETELALDSEAPRRGTHGG
jgi:hypothetical protein